ncbi:RNA polymerase sigma-70 factor (ECF subfamily) [Sphingobacterium allocomposti]|uniref:RNA polymerase sigma-70 factor (ECF subfamily) n=1 Tax=Sphingobacterium allocomposti TaxID=415956 RepID=A0A5S5DPI0_9SPHI|nr:sigma-70 family RNA polymerase sigma factor [Sphingobacterium composti Yoo et al. 2007 non Ten et al. 2007]TYP97584.1 RNA polymerase sigma-70 factor (ECF subfamily) [Sphingobacterium composti Yoo et al. 2007 non Ten et al. 2007]
MNQEAFKNTVFVLKDGMYRFAKSILVDEDEAYDLVQEVMMKLWQKRETLLRIGNIEAFAMRCVRNDAMNRKKHAKVVQLYQESVIEGVTKEQYPAMTKELILRLIHALPEKQRTVMHLRDIEEYEINEICEVMDMDERAVRVNLTRARQKVKAQLQKIFDYEKRQINGLGR